MNIVQLNVVGTIHLKHPKNHIRTFIAANRIENVRIHVTHLLASMSQCVFSGKLFPVTVVSMKEGLVILHCWSKLTIALFGIDGITGTVAD
jgi:hypothetical protein